MNCSCSKKWMDFFKAIHDKHRQAILDIIQNHKTINANGIVAKIHLSQPTISHHLKILENASVIHTKKVGKEIIYSINNESIKECCGGFMRKFTEKYT
jgi:ArsR family transcriptional regulator, arsenate/arsenite/antimonite-responsive transcriptional repressor